MDYLGKEIPKLGYGMMRLPKKDGIIDLEETKALVDRFMEAGFTYFDTAFAYEGSEEATRLALVERYPRESYQLASKLATWSGVQTSAEAKEEFFTSLERTGAGYFDFYLLHNLGGDRSRVYEKWGLWDFIAELKAEGKIRHIGFSFHDTAEVLDELLTKHPEAEFVQLQVNYADWNDPHVQSRKCYEVARKHGKPVIIMEPVKGGILASPPEPVAEVLRSAGGEGSLSSWAIRFAASLDNNIVVLSGMTTREQLEDNIRTMKDFRPLSESEQEIIRRAQEVLASYPTIPCTSCGYCAKGCPRNIPIPTVFGSVNRYILYRNLDNARFNYRFYTKTRGKAGDCVACGQCEAVCPQHIPVMDRLGEAAELFGE